MSSAFSGLQIAKSALTASQVALNVAAQNNANVNTDDYTRQRAEIVSVHYGGGSYQVAQAPSANVGQGVEVAKVTQIRDFFLDAQVRNANSEYNQWNTELSALSSVDSVFDETKTDGLHAALNDFYNQLETLSGNPGDAEYEASVRSAAGKVVETMNQYASQLTQIRDDQSTALDLAVGSVNTLVQKLNEVNQMIHDQTQRGSVSNELLDRRNSFLDSLSGYMNIQVTSNTDGTVSVYSKTESGADVDVLSRKFEAVTNGDGERVVQSTDQISGAVDVFTPKSGSLRGYTDMLNGKGSYAEGSENGFKGLSYYETMLDNLANAFAGTFNELNQESDGSAQDLFTGNTAADIAISKEWAADEGYLRETNTSAGDNIAKMINAMDKSIDSKYTGVTGTFESYSRTIMGDIAVNVDYFTDMTALNESIVNTANDKREAYIGVDTNEETINMTKYQRAFQAAARMVNIFDENLDTIINNMGIVGR